MKRSILHVALGLLLAAPAAWAHGGGHRPPPPDPPPEPPVMPPGTPPEKYPDPPSTPPPTPPPTGGPTPGPTPGVPTGPATRARGTGRSAAADASWRIWWEYNREYLLGLRQRIRDSKRVTITGLPEGDHRDPVAHRRDEVRAALRAILEKRGTHPKLKASAFIALGRAGAPEDVPLFLDALRGTGDPDEQAAAALGLGVLPPLADPALRERVRECLEELAAKNRARRVREFAHIAAGLRARHDPRITMTLARECSSFVRDAFDAAALAYACGITRDETLLPEVMLAARNGRLGGTELPDFCRAHAVAGLGHLRGPLAFDLCVELLQSRKAGVETRRSAALALGRHLREAEIDEAGRKRAQKALLKHLHKGRDGALRGYSAIALGGARPPLGVTDLRAVLDGGGNQQVRTYAALALGLAAPELEEKEARKVRAFLVEELDKAKSADLGAALCLAVGLAGASEGEKLLREQLGRDGAAPEMRKAAAEALGLLAPSSETKGLLLEALRDGAPEVAEGASFGLALLGQRGLAVELVTRLEQSSSGYAQGTYVLALGHLGESAAVDPLLALLGDPAQKQVVRELAAVALGLLAAGEEGDTLFDLDAWFNPFATTPVTHELLTIF